MANVEIVDLQHLSEFASGDISKMRRFLALFKEQSKVDFDKIVKSDTSASWRDAVHSLKCGASAIGAWQLVQATDRAQRDDIELRPDCRKTHIENMRGILNDVDAFIDSRLAGG